MLLYSAATCYKSIKINSQISQALQINWRTLSQQKKAKSGVLKFGHITISRLLQVLVALEGLWHVRPKALKMRHALARLTNSRADQLCSFTNMYVCLYERVYVCVCFTCCC